VLAGLAVALVLSSPVPLPRPILEAGVTQEAAERSAIPTVPVPVPRPEPATDLAARPDAEAQPPSPASAAHTRRPAAKPADAPLVRAMLAPPDATGAPGLRDLAPADMLCRDPRIAGDPAASFVGGIPGCGVFDPVRVASISGVPLSAPITVDCRTARAAADWLTGVAQPAARETLGSGIASLSVMGSYSCRTRNNRAGERLSEHSVGRAVDIGGVRLVDGRQISVRDHWGTGAPGVFLRRAWKGACGRFTTVIGPDGDRYHQDHLHLDTAYRDSTWCR
jgi:hypothetical protein